MSRPLLRAASLVALGGAGLLARPASPAPAASPAPSQVRGDGRGMATFGDRGLASFGDRFTESFGRRDLERFGDIPLAPMGGLVQPGPSDQRRAASRPSGERTRSRPRGRSWRFADLSPSERFGRPSSVASLRGVTLAPAALPAVTPALPPVRLPVITLDHRGTLGELRALLESEVAHARERGDLDLARSLADAIGR